jgi:hypothetical protein
MPIAMSAIAPACIRGFNISTLHVMADTSYSESVHQARINRQAIGCRARAGRADDPRQADACRAVKTGYGLKRL